jgi:hypothetical protein
MTDHKIPPNPIPPNPIEALRLEDWNPSEWQKTLQRIEDEASSLPLRQLEIKWSTASEITSMQRLADRLSALGHSDAALLVDAAIAVLQPRT